MAVDMPGRRIWSSYTAGPHKGEVLLLYKEVRTGGGGGKRMAVDTSGPK